MRQFEIWLANLHPAHGTEPGKTRPVLIIQNNLLIEAGHKSTIICPLTTNLTKGIRIMRLRIPREQSSLLMESDVLLDQIRSIDNKRLIRKLGELPAQLIPVLQQNIKYILDIDS